MVYLCEVPTHIQGMATTTVSKIPAKLERLHEFAELPFPDEQHWFQWWSPYVPKGATTALFATLEAEWLGKNRSLEFVINQEYSARIRRLVESARANPSATNEPAYRLLQVLTHLRGEKPTL